MKRIIRISGARMAGPRVQPSPHRKAGGGKGGQQFGAGPQSKLLCEVGQDQPAFATGCQMRCQASDEAEQHAAAGVVYGAFQRRAGLSRQPGRIADDEIGLARRKRLMEKSGQEARLGTAVPSPS